MTNKMRKGDRTNKPYNNKSKKMQKRFISVSKGYNKLTRLYKRANNMSAKAQGGN